MIGSLKGILRTKQAPHLLLDVAGVGYELEASMSTFYNLPDVGDEVVLLTHLVVRDDAHLLFGFASEQERHLFRTLVKISGVGTKMALAILSGMDVDQFRRCVQEKETSYLTRLPGIGKKTAARLLVEMQDRLETGATNTAKSSASDADRYKHAPINDAISALISLGYKPQEASKYVHAVATEGMHSEMIIRTALKALVK